MILGTKGIFLVFSNQQVKKEKVEFKVSYGDNSRE